MDDDETFNDFCGKLNDILNTYFNLGEKLNGSKFVRNFFRSLLERFQLEVIIIEENKDVNKLKLDKSVGNLKIYDANHHKKLSLRE